VYLLHDKKQKWYRRALPRKPFVSVTRINPDGTAVLEYARKPYLVLRVESFSPQSEDASATWLEELSEKYWERMLLAVQTTGGPSHHTEAQNRVHRLLMIEAPADATAYGAMFSGVEEHLVNASIKQIAFDPTVFDYAIAQDWQYVHYYGSDLPKHTGPAAELLHVSPSALHTAIVSLTSHRMAYDIFVFRHPKRLITEGERRIYTQYLDLLRTGKLHFAAAFPDEPYQHFVEFTVS
jgi:hypothetical protein